MPKVVDHQERRAELLGAVRRVIARHGLDAATNRTIADETGWSTGTLAHYFADKDDVIRQTLVHVHASQARRMRDLPPTDTVRDQLRAIALATLPVDAERREEAVVEISFWARSLHHDGLASLQRGDFDRWTDAVRHLVGQAAEAGRLRSGADPETTASVIVAFVDGLQLDATLHPDRFDERVIERLVDSLLDSFFA